MEENRRIDNELHWSWFTLVFSFSSAMFCVLGDTFLTKPSLSSRLWLRSLGDSLTHGVVGACCWAAVIVVEENFQRPSTWGKVLLAGVLASTIDIDHFVAAKSFDLKVRISIWSDDVNNEKAKYSKEMLFYFKHRLLCELCLLGCNQFTKKTYSTCIQFAVECDVFNMDSFKDHTRTRQAHSVFTVDVNHCLGISSHSRCSKERTLVSTIGIYTSNTLFIVFITRIYVTNFCKIINYYWSQRQFGNRVQWITSWFTKCLIEIKSSMTETGKQFNFLLPSHTHLEKMTMKFSKDVPFTIWTEWPIRDIQRYLHFTGSTHSNFL